MGLYRGLNTYGGLKYEHTCTRNPVTAYNQEDWPQTGAVQMSALQAAMSYPLPGYTARYPQAYRSWIHRQTGTNTMVCRYHYGSY